MEQVISESDDSDGSWETATEQEPGDERDDQPAGPSHADEPPEEENVESKGKGKYGCQHYKRRCKLCAPCCGETSFSCRHCHNETSENGEIKLIHQLDRKAVQTLECCLCETRQPVAENCITCGVRFGAYSCLICRFFDDDGITKGTFHCEGCGICRVGGRENFFHCDVCGCCWANSLKDDHKCIQQSMHQNCPCCMEFLFDSIKAVSVLSCGHTIHSSCCDEMARHGNYYCPVCHKTFLKPSAAKSLWEQYDRAVAETPMPQEYRETQVEILCNDCGSRSQCMFHIVGMKCTSCGSYNTTRS